MEEWSRQADERKIQVAVPNARRPYRPSLTTFPAARSLHRRLVTYSTSEDRLPRVREETLKRTATLSEQCVLSGGRCRAKRAGDELDN